MRAAVLRSPGDLIVRDWTTPEPAAGEVLVKVAAAGICAGDMSIYQGRNPYATFPQICGHEMSGQVAALGDGVTGFSIGDHVVVEPFLGCGRCYTCSIGKPNCCPRLTILGVNRHGGYGELVTAPASHVHQVPAGLPLVTAALAEPVAIAVQACRRGALQPSELVVVMGCGPIGLACIDVALARGARVVATDLLPERRAAAARPGLDVLPADEKLTAAILERTGGAGAPIVIEATGSPRAMSVGLDLIAAGGRLVIVGLVKDGLGVTFPGLDLTRKEPTIIGSRCSVDCFPEALQLLAQGKVSLARVATELSLWDAPRIFEQLSRDATSIEKAVLRA